MDAGSAAQELLDAIEDDPGAVIRDGAAVVARARSVGDIVAEATATRAIALAHLRRGDPLQALNLLDSVLVLAAETDAEYEIQMSRVGPLTELGRLDEARRAADLAVERSTGVARSRAMLQKAVFEFRIDGRVEVIERLARIEADLVDAADDVWLLRLWTNRAHMLAFTGDYTAADRDLAVVVDRYRAAGSTAALCGALVLRAEFAAHRGDLVTALGFFEEVDYLADEVRDGNRDLHRSDVYRMANLVEEGVAAARAAVEWFTEQGLELARAEAALALAEFLRGEGRTDDAVRWATEAGESFAALGRGGWREHARLIVSEIGSAGTAELLDLAEEMTRKGLASQGTACAIRVIERGWLDRTPPPVPTTEAWLARARQVGGPDLMIQIHHVRALMSLAAGEPTRAKRFLRSGMRVFEDNQAGLGATETRVSAARRAVRLGATGIRTALNDGRPMEVLRWMERTRAGSLRLPPVTPHHDPEIASDLALLRSVEQRVGDPSADRIAAELQRRIRRRSRLLGGDGRARTADLSVAHLVERLAGGGLIVLEEIDGRIVAVGVSGQTRSMWDAGSSGDLAQLSDGMRFSLQRLAAGGTSAASRQAAWDGLLSDAAELTRRLFAPVGSVDGFVVSPPARFHSIPFGAVTGRVPLIVTPSLESWLGGRTESGTEVVLVAGPNLAHSDEEVVRLGGIYDSARSLSSADATVEAVLRLIDGAAIAHVASHGTFRSDNPLFSSLQLVNGGLNVYDMQRLDRAPNTVVLSACDTGLSAAHPGNELMGMVAGLLGAGTRSVVAPVGVFPDSPGTIDVMVEMHRRLARGLKPSEALAEVAAEEDRTLAVSRMSLLCFGG